MIDGARGYRPEELAMDKMDEIRLRLARADSGGMEAWSEATALARRIMNSRGTGVADDQAVRMMGERLERVRAALSELAEVEELLGRAVTGPRHRSVRAYREQAPCVTCQRVDALVSVAVCARCSGLGPFTGVRWFDCSNTLVGSTEQRFGRGGSQGEGADCRAMASRRWL